jgi:putative transposase
MRDDPMSGSRGYWNTTSYDGLNKPTTRLMQAFYLICIQDLSLRGMVKNHALARSLRGAGIGMAVRMLEEKADKYRKRVVGIERFFLSSKLSSVDSTA